MPIHFNLKLNLKATSLDQHSSIKLVGYIKKYLYLKTLSNYYLILRFKKQIK